MLHYLRWAPGFNSSRGDISQCNIGQEYDIEPWISHQLNTWGIRNHRPMASISQNPQQQDPSTIPTYDLLPRYETKDPIISACYTPRLEPCPGPVAGSSSCTEILVPEESISGWRIHAEDSGPRDLLWKEGRAISRLYTVCHCSSEVEISSWFRALVPADYALRTAIYSSDYLCKVTCRLSPPISRRFAM